MKILKLFKTTLVATMFACASFAYAQTDGEKTQVNLTVNVQPTDSSLSSVALSFFKLSDGESGGQIGGGHVTSSNMQSQISLTGLKKGQSNTIGVQATPLYGQTTAKNSSQMFTDCKFDVPATGAANLNMTINISGTDVKQIDSIDCK